MKIFIPAAGGKVLHIMNFQEVDEVERVIISEIDPWAYGNFVADASYLLPRFDEENFFEAFDRLYEKEMFDVCIPIHDVSLHLFSKERSRFSSYPFKLAINPEETINIVSDKLATYRFFIEHDIPTAKVFTIEEFMQLDSYSFPYYIKPRYIYMRGTKRQLYMLIEDEPDIEYVSKKIRGNEKEYVVQQYLSGTEINIDFFCDSHGEVKIIVPLKRLGMGISRGITRGEIIFTDRFNEYVHRIARNMRLWGANNVQVYIESDGSLSFTEINGRFSGSSVLVKEAGVNFFYYFIKLLKGEEIEIHEKPSYLKMCSWEKPFFFIDSKVIESL